MAIIDVTDNGSSGRQLYNDGTTLNDATRLNALFNYNGGDSENDEYFFPNGTYLIPPDYSFDFGTRPINFRGETREGVILTTFDGSTGFSMRCPERIDVTKPKPAEDGMYQVDITAATIHSSFSPVTSVNVGDYIEISGGTASIATLYDVKLANYVTYMDIDSPSNYLYAGLYIVDDGVDTISGAYPYTAFTYNLRTEHVIIGSILEYDANKDEFVLKAPTIAFSSSGNVYMNNISFKDFEPYIYNPYSSLQGRNLSITNCDFKFCTRISAFEASIVANGPLHPMTPPPGPPNPDILTTVPVTGYGFKSLEYVNNTFKYIHQSIIWGMPAAHDILIQDNQISENFSTLAYFVLITGTKPVSNVARCFNYTIKGNTFTTCRIDNTDFENSTILFQFYDDTKFVNNTFIDCYGTHCYISGDNCVVDGNVMEPYINPALSGGEHLFLYKNQNVGSQQIFSNNIVDGCAVGLLHTKQTGKIVATGNDLRMSSSANYVFADTTGTLSKKLFYDAVSASNFTTLAGGSPNVGSISDGNRVYWEARENKWLAIPNPPGYTNKAVFEMDTSESPAHTAGGDPGLDILNNRIHADIVLKVDRPVRVVEVSGNAITGISQFLINTRYINTIPEPNKVHYYLQNLLIKNNPLIEIIAGTDGNNFVVEKDLIIENNTVLHTYQSWLNVNSNRGSVIVNNNYFDLKQDFHDDTPLKGGVLAIGAFAGQQVGEEFVYFENKIEDVIIKGNAINATKVANSAVRILDAENIYATDNIVNINSLWEENPIGDRAFIIINEAPTSPAYPYPLRIKVMSITNNSIVFHEDTTYRLILGLAELTPNYNGSILTISNNYSGGNDDTVMPYPPTEKFVRDTALIIFDDFVFSSDSWDDSLQVITTGTGFTCDEAVHDVKYIIDLSASSSSFTVVLPSDFLEDGQKITLSVVNAAITSGLTFTGGTVVSNPGALPSLSSLTLEYSKADTTWYVTSF